MDTLSKSCARCKTVKPVTEFYVRSGLGFPPEIPGHYVSECKACMKARQQERAPLLDSQESRVPTENVAIQALKSQCIWAQTGKSCGAADVDVVARGIVWIEVKHARLESHRMKDQFLFVATPRQRQRGFLAEVVMLICEWLPEQYTYHLFRSDDDVFYMNPWDPEERRLKVGITYVPDRSRALKHGNNRVVITESMMQEAKDNWTLIDEVRLELEARLPFERDPHEKQEKRINTSGKRW